MAAAEPWIRRIGLIKCLVFHKRFRPPPSCTVLSFSLVLSLSLPPIALASLSFYPRMINTATGALRVYCLPAAATYRSLLPSRFVLPIQHLYLFVIFCLPSCSSFTNDRPLPMRPRLCSHCNIVKRGFFSLFRARRHA